MSGGLPNRRVVGCQGCAMCGKRGRVLETRQREGQRRRRFQCDVCLVRWTTLEVVVVVDFTDARRRGPRDYSEDGKDRPSEEHLAGVWA